MYAHRACSPITILNSCLAEILELHGNLPTEQRMIASEILQRDTSDPKSPFHGKKNAKRAKAELTKYAGKRNTPWAKQLEKERSRRRDNNDKDGSSRDC
jgi:hypothetical protein